MKINSIKYYLVLFVLMSFRTELLFSQEQPTENAQPGDFKKKEKTASGGNREVFRRENTKSDYSKPTGTGFSLFVGVDGGIAKTTPEDSEKESSKSGYQFGGKLLGSIFTNSMAIDIGAGYLYNHLAGSKDTAKDLQTGEASELSNVGITTRMAYAELSPRVRLGENLQFGPVGQVMFGTDATFGAEDAGKKATILGGAQLNLLLGTGFQFRAGLQFLTDINIFERQLYLALLNIQFGIPIIRQKTIMHRIDEGSYEENTQIKKVQREVKKNVIQEVVKFLFDSESINFETASSKLSTTSDSFLRELGQFLVANRNIWSAIKVEGHTDVRGGTDYNMGLSRDRAASVRAALILGGVPAAKISSLGFGFQKPIETGSDPVSLAKNRRVEMNFEGVRDSEKLGEGIKMLREKYKK